MSVDNPCNEIICVILQLEAEKLLEKGVREAGKGQISFDIVLSCEALGEAELAEAPDLMAEAYKRIGMLWGMRFPALSLSIWRRAEELYHEIGDEKEIELLKPNLALSLFLTAERIDVRWFTSVPFQN